MSIGYQGKTTNSDADVTGARVKSERESQWGEMPGKIISFDPKTQTATIQPLYKPKFNGLPTKMPELLEVPVRQALMGGVGVTVPIKPGQNVTLRPQMRSMDNYHTGGGGDDGAPANDARSFHLSDMEAHVSGGESANNPVQNYDNENTHLRASADGEKGVKVGPTGKIKIDGPEGNLMDIIADFMELVANDQLDIKYGSSMGTGHAMKNKTALLALAQKVRGMSL